MYRFYTIEYYNIEQQATKLDYQHQATFDH